MNYNETTAWLFGCLPMYQTIGTAAYKEDLHNVIALSNYLGEPEKKGKYIHVAGTNGKGSTSHMLASILAESGYKVGLFTSPHLKDFRERIRINGQMVSEQWVCDFVAKHKAYFEASGMSFFEMTVGMAFSYFAEQETDINIIEVGLGGRLDATNIILPEVAVITNIGLDHTHILGNTLQEIANEKGGIIKQNIPTVVGEVIPETTDVFANICNKKNSELHIAALEKSVEFPSDLIGIYQESNKKTVLKTIEILQSKGWQISLDAIKEGFLNVTRNTGLMGRWQILNNNPMIVADTAHNAHGLQLTMKQLLETKSTVIRLVIGVVNDKNLDEILPLLPKNGIYYFCCPSVSRGLPVGILHDTAKKHQLNGKKFERPSEAYQAAIKDASPSDVIYIGGSTFVVAEII